MAAALVVGFRVVSKVYPGQVAIVATSYFSGDDVPDNDEGMAHDVLILLNAGYSLLDFKNGVVAAVQAKATELGLTVAGTDIDMPSYEHGT